MAMASSAFGLIAFFLFYMSPGGGATPLQQCLAPSLLQTDRAHSRASSILKENIALSHEEIVSIPLEEMTTQVKRVLLAGDNGFKSVHKVNIWVQRKSDSSEFRLCTPTGMLIDLSAAGAEVKNEEYEPGFDKVVDFFFEDDITSALMKVKDIAILPVSELVKVKRVLLEGEETKSIHRLSQWVKPTPTSAHLWTMSGFLISVDESGAQVQTEHSGDLGDGPWTATQFLDSGDALPPHLLPMEKLIKVKRVVLRSNDGVMSGHKVIGWVKKQESAEVWTLTGHNIKLTESAWEVQENNPRTLGANPTVQSFGTDKGVALFVQDIASISAQELKGVQKVLLSDDNGWASTHGVFIWTKPTDLSVVLRTRSGLRITVSEDGSIGVTVDDHASVPGDMKEKASDVSFVDGESEEPGDFDDLVR